MTEAGHTHIVTHYFINNIPVVSGRGYFNNFFFFTIFSKFYLFFIKKKLYLKMQLMENILIYYIFISTKKAKNYKLMTR